MMLLLVQCMLWLGVSRYLAPKIAATFLPWAFWLSTIGQGALVYVVLLLGFPFSPIWLIAFDIAILAAMVLRYGRKSSPGSMRITFDRGSLAFAPLVLLLLAESLKAIYWPVVEHDAVFGYDLLARYLQSDGHLFNSLFNDRMVVEACGPRLMYPPFLAIQGAIYGSMGLSPKWFIVLATWNFYWIAADFFTRYLGKAWAGVAVFAMAITPEWLSHSSLFLTNLPVAMCFGLAVIGAFQHRPVVYQSICLLAAILLRSDSFLLFPAFFLLSFLLKTNASASWIRQWSWHVFVLMVAFISWNAALKMHDLQGSYFLEWPGFNGDKALHILKVSWEMISDAHHFGWGFFIPFFYLITTFSSSWKYLLVWVTAWAAYTGIYYFIHDDGTLFAEPGGWMYSGYKRGLFSLLILGWILAFSRPPRWRYSQKKSRPEGGFD